MPPMPPDFLQQLLARRDTWWGRESTGTGQGQSTGFNDLDRILAGGGWPEQGLVELLCPLPCPAVLHLLLPVLASLLNEGLSETRASTGYCSLKTRSGVGSEKGGFVRSCTR